MSYPNAKRAENPSPCCIELTHRPGLSTAEVLPFQIFASEILTVVNQNISRNTVFNTSLLDHRGYGVRTGLLDDRTSQEAPGAAVDGGRHPRSYDLPAAFHLHSAEHV